MGAHTRLASQAIAARYSNNYYPYLLASTNSGATWYNVTGGGLNAQQQWQRVSISTGGFSAFALPNTNSSIMPKYSVPLLSTAILWTPLGSKRWKAVANSNNGQYVLLATTAGLWRSSNQGADFSQVP
jgi:hypothetical protein